jgi:hypothetical protein
MKAAMTARAKKKDRDLGSQDTRRQPPPRQAARGNCRLEDLFGSSD